MGQLRRALRSKQALAHGVGLSSSGPYRSGAKDRAGGSIGIRGLLDANLLDANLLIALVVEDHVHHDAAEQWSVQRGSFATCPITQGSLVRFLVREGASGSEAGRLLADVLAAEHHRFWPADVGYDGIDLGSVVGHRQVTDVYLAGLARARGGRLATMDRGLAAVHPDVVDLVPT